eukprot:CAMPEP_0116950372 /NCGR_PEP_ID=MMETSP0467-20121206/39432_1 /TAXON_ID=283647 /ORGANISM="Mesodinium pulex, Strain SPMC105" /LENGTH=257 /DNA_ID=CAMNT_0004635109 /DNA_START=1446 /DNA_END=2219 /DNA_ORIENTATION=+
MPRALDESQDARTPCTWKLWSTIKVPAELDGLRFTCTLKDQGWGNLKGALDLALCRGPRSSDAKENGEWAHDGSGQFSHVLHRMPLASAEHELKEIRFTLDRSSQIILSARAGDYFELHYKVGGGGGHRLFVYDPEFVITILQTQTQEKLFNDSTNDVIVDEMQELEMERNELQKEKKTTDAVIFPSVVSVFGQSENTEREGEIETLDNSVQLNTELNFEEDQIFKPVTDIFTGSSKQDSKQDNSLAAKVPADSDIV